MTVQVLFVQGAGGYAEDQKLADSLQAALGAEYRVVYPPMPDEDVPVYDAWASAIEREIAAFDEGFIAAGHSFGASVLLKYFAETQPEKRTQGIFLVATPHWRAEDWAVDEYALASDFAAHLPDVPVYLYHSRDDEVVPFAHMALYAGEMPHAVVREIESGGHQLNDDLSRVAADIVHVVTQG